MPRGSFKSTPELVIELTNIGEVGLDTSRIVTSSSVVAATYRYFPERYMSSTPSTWVVLSKNPTTVSASDVPADVTYAYLPCIATPSMASRDPVSVTPPTKVGAVEDAVILPVTWALPATVSACEIVVVPMPTLPEVSI